MTKIDIIYCLYVRSRRTTGCPTSRCPGRGWHTLCPPRLQWTKVTKGATKGATKELAKEVLMVFWEEEKVSTGGPAPAPRTRLYRTTARGTEERHWASGCQSCCWTDTPLLPGERCGRPPLGIYHVLTPGLLCCMYLLCCPVSLCHW